MLAFPLLASCQSVNTEQTTTIEAVVETVDPVVREILLRGNADAQSGALVTMIVSPRVQRLNEIHAGDRVVVTHYQALAAQMARPFLLRAAADGRSRSAARNETAALPGGEVTRVRRGRVTITALDPATGSVSFVGPGNIVRTVVPKNPQVQQFVRGLSVGDQVDIVYQEAFAIESCRCTDIDAAFVVPAGLSGRRTHRERAGATPHRPPCKTCGVQGPPGPWRVQGRALAFACFLYPDGPVLGVRDAAGGRRHRRGGEAQQAFA